MPDLYAIVMVDNLALAEDHYVLQMFLYFILCYSLHHF